MKELNLGDSDFKSTIENNNYFVDKSLFVEEVIKAQKAVILLPRPRRFGKTMNLSMLKYFFVKNETDNKKLFTKLKIWQTGNDIKKHCGKYPVISLSFKDAKEEKWNNTLNHIKIEIAEAYKQHIFLLESNILYDFEKDIFTKIITRKADDVDFQASLKNLSEYLQRYHNEKVVILIDEYDTPIQAGYKKFYDDVTPFMRNLLSGAFKDNSNLYKGIITGILRVSRESIFSGLNNISVYSIINHKFSDKFGFTEPEVKQILSDFKVTTGFDQIKKWYDGYKFGKCENIYNPWSILCYVSEIEDGLKTYWANTSSNELIKHEIKKKGAENIRKDILDLINNITIIRDLEENFVFPDLESRKSLLWTLLTFSGYLSVKNKISRKEYELAIPNYEIKTIFQDTIIEWFEGDLNVIKSLLKDTASYLVNNEISKFETGFRQIMGDTFSYYDTAKNHEYVYQSYILGLLAIIGDDYMIKSNRESGEGRYDIMLIPRNSVKTHGHTSQYGIVIEIKQIERWKEKESNEDFAKRINLTIEKTGLQIDKNKYYKELVENKIAPDKIIKVPIVFAGKEPYVLPIKMK
ncbi:MAG: AAA family ATPase [Bacteroidota bacterium]|nr:AAA family ATPase [Bacteroidota bacterium]